MYKANAARRKIERKRRKEPRRLFRKNIEEINQSIKEAVRKQLSCRSVLFYDDVDDNLRKKIKIYYESKGYKVEETKTSFGNTSFVIYW